jgi:MtN3 and saliva related transmembrane protein
MPRCIGARLPAGKSGFVDVEVMGLLAGAMTTAAFVPQAWKTWRTRSARDFSLALLVLLVVGNSLWLAYGALVGSLGLVAANMVTVPLTASILWVKLARG